MKTKPFNLTEYLSDPSQKVVTRSGHKVRILCTNQRGNMPIVALVEFETLDGVQIFYSDGKAEIHREYDLFFLDESEEKLTEFESALIQFVHDSFDSLLDVAKGDALSKWKDKLLAIARKQIYEEVVKSVEKYAHDKGYEQGKIDVLKDLPKWKKANSPAKNRAWICLSRGDMDYPHYTDYLEVGDYYLSFDDLEKLPKEE